jgi:two-component system response regulator RegA
MSLDHQMGGFRLERAPAVAPRYQPRPEAPRATEGKVIVLDDDAPFSQRLAVGLEGYGLGVFRTSDRTEAYGIMHDHRPQFAVMELRLLRDRLAHHSGLELINEFRQLRPGIRILIATYYSSIVTAVTAIKAGAVNYLPKPIGVEEVARALLEPYEPPAIRDQPISANRLRWEHILRVFHQCDQNVSETARRLSMHRRTLQRMLNKRPPNE